MSTETSSTARPGNETTRSLRGARSVRDQDRLRQPINALCVGYGWWQRWWQPARTETNAREHPLASSQVRG